MQDLQKILLTLKGGFFYQKVGFVFQISKINYSKSVNNLFKFQAQDSDLEYFFWRFEKQIALSEKNPPQQFIFSMILFVFFLPGDEDDDSPFGALEKVLIGWLLTLESSRSLQDRSDPKLEPEPRGLEKLGIEGGVTFLAPWLSR